MGPVVLGHVVIGGVRQHDEIGHASWFIGVAIDQSGGRVSVLGEPLGGDGSDLLPVAVGYIDDRIGIHGEVAPNAVVRDIEAKASEVEWRCRELDAELAALVIRDIEDIGDDDRTIGWRLATPIGVGRPTVHAHISAGTAESHRDVGVLFPRHAAIYAR